MRALCWNKKLMLLKSVPRLIAYMVLPMLMLALLHLKHVEPMSFGFAYVFVTAFLLNCVTFSIEDLVLSEAILATPMSLRGLWLSIFMVNVVFTLVVPLIFFVIYVLCFHIKSLVVFLSSATLGALLSGALQLLGLTHFSDYSVKKQIIASVGALLNLLVVILLPTFIILTPNSSMFFIATDTVLFFAGTALFSLAIVGASFIVFGRGNPERLFINVNSFSVTIRGGNFGLVVE